MTDERWARVDALVHSALARPEAEREAFVRDACGADAAVCAEVLSLLAQAHSGDSFLEPRSYELPATAGATLSSGLRIGPYEVVSAIGAGGMGEVYRARDTKLGRDVAIKVLPSAFHTDPDRRARLEREARLLAALNHSHIAAIYGLEESDGVQALVLVVKPKP